MYAWSDWYKLSSSINDQSRGGPMVRRLRSANSLEAWPKTCQRTLFGLLVGVNKKLKHFSRQQNEKGRGSFVSDDNERYPSHLLFKPSPCFLTHAPTEKESEKNRFLPSRIWTSRRLPKIHLSLSKFLFRIQIPNTFSSSSCSSSSSRFMSVWMIQSGFSFDRFVSFRVFDQLLSDVEVGILGFCFDWSWKIIVNTMRSLLSLGLGTTREQGSNGSRRTHLYLNVYDLTPINNYLYWFGLGIFHSGIEGMRFPLFSF